MKQEIKKLMIFSPHQDDEINIAGGLIPKIINNVEVIVVYSTNGDYNVNAKIRAKECIDALKVLGVLKRNIYFLGYSDQYSSEDVHLYNTYNKDVWISKNKFTKTYHPMGDDEVAVNCDNLHHDFNRFNFVNDIVYIIEKEKPDYILSIDFDSHADHRALSLSVEWAIGKIIDKDNNYRPKVFKSFAYPTVYFGYDDLNFINVRSTKFNTEPYSYSIMENPYYLWENRVRFPLEKKEYTKFLPFNRVYKAIKCHKSQCFIRRVYATVNGDQIFWQRRTDNLLNVSKLDVTSGEKEKLRDFMLFDCKNIMKGNSQKPQLYSNAWIPDVNDENPTIKIQFDEIKSVSQINLYHAVGTDDVISKIEVKTDNNYKNAFDLQRTNNNITELFFDNLRTKNLEIKILKKTGNDAGLSELEVFEKKKNDIQFIKLEIDGDFAYKYYYDDEIFKIYSYDGICSRYLQSDEYEIECDTVLLKNNKFILKRRKNVIKIVLKTNSNICDNVILYKKDKFFLLQNTIINIINKIYVEMEYFKQRLVRKVKKLLKMY